MIPCKSLAFNKDELLAKRLIPYWCRISRPLGNFWIETSSYSPMLGKESVICIIGKDALMFSNAVETRLQNAYSLVLVLTLSSGIYNSPLLQLLSCPLVKALEPATQSLRNIHKIKIMCNVGVLSNIRDFMRYLKIWPVAYVDNVFKQKVPSAIA